MFSVFQNPNLQFSRSGSIAFVIATFLATCSVTAALVSLTIRICRKQGWLAKPRADRWHRGTPCLFGGVPIWVGFVTVSVAVLPFSKRRPLAVLQPIRVNAVAIDVHLHVRNARV